MAVTCEPLLAALTSDTVVGPVTLSRAIENPYVVDTAKNATEFAVGRFTTTLPSAPQVVPFTVAVNVPFVTRFVTCSGDVEPELSLVQRL